MRKKALKNLLSNILFQYTVLSMTVTIVIASALVGILVSISLDQSITVHSTFYSDFIDSIPTNFPEIIPPIISKKTVDRHDHDFEHFLTDLQLYPTFNKVTVYSKNRKMIWSYKEPDSFELPYMNNMMDSALSGEFSYYIVQDGENTLLHTFYPFIIDEEVLAVFEITDIDNKTGFSIDSNKLAIIRIVSIGGVIFYILLFILFYRVYNRQNLAFNRLDKSQKLTLYSMSLLAELRDNETGSHILRTKEYCRLVAVKLSKEKKYKKYLTENYILDMERSAPLHDIGKVGIPDSILLKPGKLSREEFEVIKGHPEMGAVVLEKAAEALEFQSFFEIGIQIVLYHHENWDGSGYPKGLSGEDIPLSARIMTLADVYDALTTVRPYKKAYTHEKAKEIILSESGKKFDPDIVKVFIKIEEDFKKIASAGNLTGSIL